MSYYGIYDDIDYCRKELLLARNIFGDSRTTEDEYDAMLKGLGLVFLYCPEELRPIAEATLIEANQRKIYFMYYRTKDK